MSLAEWIAIWITIILGVLALLELFLKPVRRLWPKVRKYILAVLKRLTAWLEPSSKELMSEESLAEELIKRGCLTLVERTPTDMDIIPIRSKYWTNVIIYGPRFDSDMQAKTADYIAHHIRDKRKIDKRKWGLSYFSCREDDPYFAYFGYIDSDAIYNLAQKVAKQLEIKMESPWDIKTEKVIFISAMVQDGIKDCFESMKINGVQEILAYFLLEPPSPSLQNLWFLGGSPTVEAIPVIRLETLKNPRLFSLLLQLE